MAQKHPVIFAKAAVTPSIAITAAAAAPPFITITVTASKSFGINNSILLW
jgi:hypothetical protein